MAISGASTDASARVPNSPTGATDARAEGFAQLFRRLHRNVATVIKGKDDEIELALICLFAEGHLLVEDVPGVGKTHLARALAASIEAAATRIQFTPDLLPSDVTGVSIYRQSSNDFEFHPGPVFGNVVLADEINRASPRTQSALLEVMAERQVTVDGVARDVPRPFMVVATQNPIDMDGTYPLPEAQLDRFLMRTSMGYPDHAAELEILLDQSAIADIAAIRPVVSLRDAERMVGAAEQIHVAHDVADYLLRIVTSTRTAPEVRLPVSPRGSVGLMRAAQARALAAGRSYVTPDDVRSLARPVLAHRIVLTPDASLSGARVETVLDRLIAAVPVPTSSSGTPPARHGGRTDAGAGSPD
ncbi:MAG: MoxR family ATPase [Actinomycetota bacterium]